MMWEILHPLINMIMTFNHFQFHNYSPIPTPRRSTTFGLIACCQNSVIRTLKAYLVKFHTNSPLAFVQVYIHIMEKHMYIDHRINWNSKTSCSEINSDLFDSDSSNTHLKQKPKGQMQKSSTIKIKIRPFCIILRKLRQAFWREVGVWNMLSINDS